MAPITVDPNALSGAGVSVGAVGDGLAAAMSTLTATFNANTGQDSAGLLFGEQQHESRGRTSKPSARGQRMPQHRLRGAGQRNELFTRRGELGYQRPQPAIVAAAVSGTAICARFAECHRRRCRRASLVVCCRGTDRGYVAERRPVCDADSRGGVACLRQSVAPRQRGHVRRLQRDRRPALDEAELIQKPIRDIGTAFSDVAFSCEKLAGALEQFASDVQQTQQAIRDLLHKLGSIGGIVGTFYPVILTRLYGISW